MRLFNDWVPRCCLALLFTSLVCFSSGHSLAETPLVFLDQDAVAPDIESPPPAKNFPDEPGLNSLPAKEEGNRAINQKALELATATHSTPVAEWIDRAESLVGRASFDDFSLAEEYLESEGHSRLVPSLAAAYLNLQRTQPELARKKRWSRKVAARMVPFWVEEISAIETGLRKEPFMRKQLMPPASYPEYENWFWKMHVGRNQLAHARTIANICDQKLIRLQKERNKESNASAILSKPFDEWSEQLAAIAKDLKEREMELRILRLEDSAALLGIASKATRKEKLKAGFAAQVDYTALTEFYGQTSLEEIARPELKDESMLQSIREIYAMAKKDGAEQLRKGTQLMVGLHWWLRGRYGNSSEAYGLLKPKASMKSDRLMFALSMPRQFGEPAYPSSPFAGRSPTYERRHYYHWAVEKRDVYKSSSFGVQKDSSRTSDSKLLSLEKRDMGQFY